MEQYQSMAVVIKLEFFESYDKCKEKGSETSRDNTSLATGVGITWRLVAKQKFLWDFQYKTTDFVMEW